MKPNKIEHKQIRYNNSLYRFAYTITFLLLIRVVMLKNKMFMYFTRFVSVITVQYVIVDSVVLL